MKRDVLDKYFDAAHDAPELMSIEEVREMIGSTPPMAPPGKSSTYWIAKKAVWWLSSVLVAGITTAVLLWESPDDAKAAPAETFIPIEVVATSAAETVEVQASLEAMEQLALTLVPTQKLNKRPLKRKLNGPIPVVKLAPPTDYTKKQKSTYGSIDTSRVKLQDQNFLQYPADPLEMEEPDQTIETPKEATNTPSEDCFCKEESISIQIPNTYVREDLEALVSDMKAKGLDLDFTVADWKRKTLIKLQGTLRREGKINLKFSCSEFKSLNIALKPTEEDIYESSIDCLH